MEWEMPKEQNPVFGLCQNKETNKQFRAWQQLYEEILENVVVLSWQGRFACQPKLSKWNAALNALKVHVKRTKKDFFQYYFFLAW